jgi:hypothetical protein
MIVGIEGYLNQEASRSRFDLSKINKMDVL